MSKLAVLIASDTIAGGKARQGGKIYEIEDDVVHGLVGSGKGRIPTEDEIARLGITPDPELDPGQVVRKMGSSAAPAPSSFRGLTADDDQ